MTMTTEHPLVFSTESPAYDLPRPAVDVAEQTPLPVKTKPPRRRIKGDERHLNRGEYPAWTRRMTNREIVLRTFQEKCESNPNRTITVNQMKNWLPYMDAASVTGALGGLAVRGDLKRVKLAKYRLVPTEDVPVPAKGAYTRRDTEATVAVSAADAPFRSDIGGLPIQGVPMVSNDPETDALAILSTIIPGGSIPVSAVREVGAWIDSTTALLARLRSL